MRYNMEPSDKRNCPNHHLKIQGYFWIQRVPMRRGYLFRAALVQTEQHNFLSLLGATHGKCNLVSTEKASRRCGLATAMMFTCFLDEDVTRNGGINPNTNQAFKDHPDMQKIARDSCNIIVYTQCMPDPTTPVDVCGGYLKGALKAAYYKIFLVNHLDRMKVLQLEYALNKFKANPEGFIADDGRNWYLCKP